MVKFFLSFLSSIALAAALLAPASAGIGSGGRVVASGETLTLAELFEDPGDAGGTFAVRAPRPGARLVLRGDELERIARRNGLAWRSPGRRFHIEIVRPGRTVPRSVVVQEIEGALEREGMAGRFQVELPVSTPALHVALGDQPSVAVEDIVVSRRSRRFTATLSAPANDPDAARVQVSGRFVAIAEIPVLSRQVRVGEIIAREDIEWLSLPASKVHRNVVAEAASLIGMSPKRPIRIGRPVRPRDVQRPVMVAKGSLVTMTLIHPPLVMTVTGRAIEDGSRGDAIRVRNTQSNIVVQGIVAGPSKIVVESRQRHIPSLEK